MLLLLNTGLRKTVVIVAATVATAALAFPLWRYFRVDRLEAAGSPSSLQRAIALQPDKPELYNRLGLLFLFSDDDNSNRALAVLQKATQLNPYSGAYWVDLAVAREQQGDLSGADQALQSARRIESNTPNVLWQDMNFALRTQQTDRALRDGRELLAKASEYTGRVLSQLAPVVPVPALVRDVLPATLRSFSDAIEIITKQNHMDAAGVLWTRILALNEAPITYYLKALLDGALEAGDVSLAQRVWADSITRGWIAGDVTTARQPLYNGDFHHPFLNYGFDWRIVPQPDASVWLEGQGPMPGLQSLCVEFSDKARAGFAHIAHAIPVEPNTFYTLHGYLRTNRLSSPGGAYLQVAEALPRAGQVSTTSPVMGTGGWREVALRLRTGSETRMVQLSLVRPGVGSGEAAASGQVCMAALEWTSLGQSSAPGAAR
ncbi:MAG: hypothetical protein GZ088_07355 [Acidipila sp.]|nr:hypothetical protein [Acidipila sp.]